MKKLFAVLLSLLAFVFVPSSAQATSITWTGDMSFDTSSGLPPGGVEKSFRGIKKYLQSNLTIGNLEGTLGSSGTSKCSGGSNCYAFQAPSSYAQAFKNLGFDWLNQANNHAQDAGEKGRLNTKKILQKNSIDSIGAKNSIVVSNVNGTKVAGIGFSPYNWSSNLNDIKNAKRLVRKARKKADVVIVIIHAGAEGANKTHVTGKNEYAFGENRGNPQKFAHAVVDSGASLVLGSGPHVLRGIEKYKNRLIAYSLGNFAGYRTLSSAGNTALSGVLRVEINKQGVVKKGRLFSLKIRNNGLPKRDFKNQSASFVNRLSKSDFGSRRFRIHSNGSFSK